MLRSSALALLVGSACVTSMQRAPKQIPADGRVECTDSRAMPIGATVAAVVSAGIVVHAGTSVEKVLDHGLEMWFPLLLGTSVLIGMGFNFAISAGLGYGYAAECRDAKQRGAERAGVVRRRAEARAEAGTLWKRAAAAAREGDCALVRELDPQVRALDDEFHAVVFARDAAIARCLDARSDSGLRDGSVPAR